VLRCRANALLLLLLLRSAGQRYNGRAGVTGLGSEAPRYIIDGRANDQPPQTHTVSL